MDLSSSQTFNKLSLRNKESDDGSSSRKKGKRKKRRKTVHKVITHEMALAEVHRKNVDNKIYQELSIPLPTEYRGPQIDVR